MVRAAHNSSMAQELNRRRGRRTNCGVPIEIAWLEKGGPARQVRSRTSVVNFTGCLVVSNMNIEPQQRVLLTNLATEKNAEAIVAWKGKLTSEGWEVGIELIDAGFDFWGIDL